LMLLVRIYPISTIRQVSHWLPLARIKICWQGSIHSLPAKYPIG
jgi:hypothetical protein